MKKENISDVIEKLNEAKSDTSARKLLEERGRNCISKTMLKKAEEARKGAKDDEEILDNLKKSIKLLKESKGNLYMVYPKCFCHHVKDYKGEVPKRYCYCSEFWVRQLFETAFDRDVEVRIEKSVLWGDERCMIKILL